MLTSHCSLKSISAKQGEIAATSSWIPLLNTLNPYFYNHYMAFGLIFPIQNFKNPIIFVWRPILEACNFYWMLRRCKWTSPYSFINMKLEACLQKTNFKTTLPPTSDFPSKVMAHTVRSINSCERVRNAITNNCNELLPIDAKKK